MCAEQGQRTETNTDGCTKDQLVDLGSVLYAKTLSQGERDMVNGHSSNARKDADDDAAKGTEPL